MKEIPLAGGGGRAGRYARFVDSGLRAVVDDEDYDKFVALRWRPLRTKGTTYAVTWKDGNNNFLMHRLIMDPPMGVEVDHIDGNGLDNRRVNLRFATRAQQLAHTLRLKRSRSGFRGVRRSSGREHWEAYIKVNRKHITIGMFATAEDAARARDAEARKLHKEFAVLNFPEETP